MGQSTAFNYYTKWGLLGEADRQFDGQNDVDFYNGRDMLRIMPITGFKFLIKMVTLSQSLAKGARVMDNSTKHPHYQ